MNAFGRSWEITKLSFNVIKQDKELLLFPVLAGIFSIIFAIAMLFPTVITVLLKGFAPQFTVLWYVMVFILYLGLAFIATFFNTCVVYTTKKRLEGGNATFMESLKFSSSRIHLILLWSLVSATVGLILRILDNIAERMGQIGQIIMGLFISLIGATWSIITIFVIPSMVYHNLTPFKAIKNSIVTLRKTWGESLIRYFGLGLVEFVLFILGIVITIGLVILLKGLGLIAIITIVLLGIFYLIVLTLVFGVANTVFNVALYSYANTGKVPNGFSQEIMINAFKAKAPKLGRRGVI